jgi:chitodextrinase
VANYTSTGLSYYGQLVSPPDTTPPSAPANLTGSAGYTSVSLSWNAATDNVGVAGYNIFRCQPSALGQPCTVVWIGQTSSPQYLDTLTSNTPYNYQVQAFDLANNVSPLSPVLSLLTYLTQASSPTALSATAVSAQEIDLSWTPPQNTTGLSKYLILSGPSPSSLVQIAIAPAANTTYRNLPLSPATSSYYAVEAVEEGVTSPMSTLASAATIPLPNAPGNVTAAPSPTTIVLTWQQTQAPGGLPVGSYQILEGTTPGQLAKIATVAGGTTYTVRSLNAGTTYYFEIVAVDTDYEDSVPSNQISATTLPLPPPPTNLSATAPTATQITLTWQWAPLPSGLPIARYLIDCGTSPTSLTQIGVATSLSYTD